MELFQRILKTAVEGGASDVHLKIGTPVVYRINRQLVAIDCPYPTLEWMNKMVELVAPQHLKKRLEQEREIDFSYFVPALAGFEPTCFSSVANGVSQCVMLRPLFRALKN
jgi:twitching motility protein PilT